MRRTEREITDKDRMFAILRDCGVCCLALCAGDKPYAVPLCYGYTENRGRLTLWFHCAKEGQKLDIIRMNPNAAFVCDLPGELILGGEACQCSMKYASVLGEGRLSVCADDNEKRMGLEAIMRHYAPERAFAFSREALDGVYVLKLDVTAWSAKSNIKEDKK